MNFSKLQIEAVLFDLGGTLIKTTEIPRVMKKILKHHGIKRSLEEIVSAKKRAEEELNFRDLTTFLDEFWIQWNLRILTNLKVDSNLRLLAEFIAAHWWDYCDVTLFPDAEKVLPSLKARGLKIGIITNGLQSDVNEILPKVNLQDFFDVVVVIDTLKKMKPDAEVFLHALDRLETTISTTIFIGDEIEADYKGAQKIGLPVYLIDRANKFDDKNIDRLFSLEGLLKLSFKISPLRDA